MRYPRREPYTVVEIERAGKIYLALSKYALLSRGEVARKCRIAVSSVKTVEWRCALKIARLVVAQGK
jgi:hypothetical protein